MEKITCNDVRKVFPFGCCESCHEDWDYDPFYISERTPEDNINGVESSVVAELCCTAPELSRSDYAKILRLKRKG